MFGTKSKLFKKIEMGGSPNRPYNWIWLSSNYHFEHALRNLISAMVQVNSKYIVIALWSKNIILIFMTISPSLSIMIGGSLVFCNCLFSNFDLDPLYVRQCMLRLTVPAADWPHGSCQPQCHCGGRQGGTSHPRETHHIWELSSEPGFEIETMVFWLLFLPINSLKWKWWEKKKYAKKNLMKLKRDHNSEADLLESRHTGD